MERADRRFLDVCSDHAGNRWAKRTGGNRFADSLFREKRRVPFLSDAGMGSAVDGFGEKHLGLAVLVWYVQ